MGSKHRSIDSRRTLKRRAIESHRLAGVSGSQPPIGTGGDWWWVGGVSDAHAAWCQARNSARAFSARYYIAPGAAVENVSPGLWRVAFERPEQGQSTSIRSQEGLEQDTF